MTEINDRGSLIQNHLSQITKRHVLASRIFTLSNYFTLQYVMPSIWPHRPNFLPA